MKKLLLCMSILACVPAFAAGNSNNSNNTTNTYNQQSYGGTGGQGGVGGAGGQGGAGGSATSSAGASAGAAAINANDLSNKNSNTVNSSNKTTNNNANVQGQQQGQAQGQQQSSNSNSSVKNSGNSASSSGVKNSGNSASSSNSGGNSQSNSGNNASTSVSVGGDTYEGAHIPVATAYAAPLAASNGTCMGSSSGGLQLPGVGLSLGSTWNDDGCDARYDATALTAAGQNKAAIARLCERPKIAAAMKAAGTPCPGTESKPGVATAAPIGSGSGDAPAKVASAGYDGPDPFIRARYNLPPLK